ncbi:MAG: Mitochondrial zinc maintenance protein 1, mitochondrial [Claussenomyces sp. TS43310]|nr:MAG: Mitochondrial zinc maintenance protein 1, mitochondrial [Claussenomyces sp. TS43310]
MALAAYRHLLRSASIAFKGDIPLLHAARDQARIGFQKNASLQLDDPAVATGIEHAESVAAILRQNIVQGKHIGDDRYKLRIHEETERGDNDTVRMPNGQKVVIDGKTCADR